jgi:hypothetical protein
MRILKQRPVQAAVAGASVIAAGLYLTDGAPLAWAIAAVWAVLVVVAVAQAAQS